MTYIYADTIHAIQIQQFRHIHLILNVKFINIFLASGMIEYGKIPEKSLLQLLVTFYSANKYSGIHLVLFGMLNKKKRRHVLTLKLMKLIKYVVI